MAEEVIFGVDALSTGLTPSILHGAGARFVCQYLGNLTAARALEYLSAGIDVVLIYETGPQNALGGSAQGHADAVAALSKANAIGAPGSAAVYFAVDFNPTPEQRSTIVAYFKAAQAVLGVDRVGGYGGMETVTWLHAAGVKWLWQTYAWSGGQWFAPAQMQQYLNGQHVGGIAVDLDHATVSNFGQWSSNVSSINNTGVDVPLDATDKAWISAQLDAAVKSVLDQVNAQTSWVGAHVDAKTAATTSGVNAYTKTVGDALAKAVASIPAGGTAAPAPKSITGTITGTIS